MFYRLGILVLFLSGSNGVFEGYTKRCWSYQLYGVSWCKELRLKSPVSLQPVALVSSPGSGNTWLRYLLQQATGVLTGSVYVDPYLIVHGFPAENVTDGSVLLVKTHDVPGLENTYQSAIVLMRNPRDALLSEYNRQHSGHLDAAPRFEFMKSEWTKYVFLALVKWESLYRHWLTHYSGPKHVVLYEMLVRDTRRTLLGVLDFLNQTVTNDSISCAIANKEGVYRRMNKLSLDPFTPEMYKAFDVVKERVLTLVAQIQYPVQKCLLPIKCALSV